MEGSWSELLDMLMAGEIDIDDIRPNDIYPDIRQKGVDMSMGIDAIECARQKVCDTIVLVTGDGDLAPAVRKIRSYGVKVQVASFKGALNGSLSDAANGTIILDDLRMVDACGVKEITAY